MKQDSIKSFFNEVIIHLKTADLRSRASYIAYSLLMASIPIILVFIQLISVFLANPEYALSGIIESLPGDAGTIVTRVIEILASSTSGFTISISVISALWLGSNGFNSLINSTNLSYGFETKRNSIVQRLFAVIYTAIFIVALILLLLFYVFYNQIHNLIGNIFFLQELLGKFWTMAGNVMIRFLPILLMTLVLIAFYKSTTLFATGNITWKEAAMGGIFAALSIVLATSIYSWFMDNISSWSIYYGSLASFLALLAWLRFVCQILLAGAEIIAAYRASRGKQSFTSIKF